MTIYKHSCRLSDFPTAFDYSRMETAYEARRIFIAVLVEIIL